MKYWITYKVEARYTAEVDAESLEDAIALANDKYLDCDIGDLEDVDGEPVTAEDERGEYIWEI